MTRRLTPATLIWFTCVMTVFVKVVGLATVASAQTDPVFDAKGFQQNRAYLSELPFEHLDTATGNVILTFTDLVLPGNGGRELRFERTYNSHGLVERGRFWNFGIAGMVMRINEKPEPPPDTVRAPSLLAPGQ